MDSGDSGFIIRFPQMAQRHRFRRWGDRYTYKKFLEDQRENERKIEAPQSADIKEKEIVEVVSFYM